MHWPQTGNGNDRPTWSFVYYCFIIYHSMTLVEEFWMQKSILIWKSVKVEEIEQKSTLHVDSYFQNSISKVTLSYHFLDFLFSFSFFSGCASFYATFSTRILHLLFVIFGTLSSADLVPRWVLYKMWNLSFICLSPQGFMRMSLLKVC